MKMKNKWKRMVTAVLAVCLLAAELTVASPDEVTAAAKSYVLEMGETQTIQLDGKGTKEQVRYELQDQTFVLYINDKAVYQKKTTAVYGDVYIGSIDKSNKVLDIIVALYTASYTGSYESVDYCRYENGKFKKVQNLLKYLNATLEKKIGKVLTSDQTAYCYFHPMEAISESISMTGENELEVTLCLPIDEIDAKDDFGTYHAFYTLKLKNGKLVKKYTNAQGSMDEYGTIMNNKVTFYTAANGTKKAFTAEKGEDIYFSEYKYVKNSLYVKGETMEGKKGWLKAADAIVLIGNHV